MRTIETLNEKPSGNKKAWHSLILILGAPMLLSIWFFVPDWIANTSGAVTASKRRREQQSEAIQRAGQVGDKFGSVNALFSGFTLLGLIYTIRQQRLEQKEEEEDRRRERLALQNQTAIFQAQLKALDEKLEFEKALLRPIVAAGWQSTSAGVTRLYVKNCGPAFAIIGVSTEALENPTIERVTKAGEPIADITSLNDAGSLMLVPGDSIQIAVTAGPSNSTAVFPNKFVLVIEYVSARQRGKLMLGIIYPEVRQNIVSEKLN